MKIHSNGMDTHTSYKLLKMNPSNVLCRVMEWAMFLELFEERFQHWSRCNSIATGRNRAR